VSKELTYEGTFPISDIAYEQAIAVLTGGPMQPLSLQKMDPISSYAIGFGETQWTAYFERSSFGQITTRLSAIEAELAGLRAAIAQQHSAIADQHRLILELAGSNAPEITLEDVDDDEARERIAKLFESEPGPLFYDEISERLGLPLQQVVEACNILESGGLIGELAEKDRAKKHPKR